jgi:hypothetical protein
MSRSHVFLITAALLHAQAYAHHSSSIYDMRHDVSIEGTIVRLAWANPHVYFWVEETSDGERLIWEVEAPPPPVLRRLGWTQDTFGMGDAVTIGGKRGREPARDILLMRSLEKPGSGLPVLGEEAFNSLAQPDSERTAQATGLDGTWLTLLNYEILASLSSPDNLPLTDAGKEASERFEEVDRQALSCTEHPPPIQMLSPDVKSIEVRDDVVIIRAEFDATQRTVHLNEDSHEGAAEIDSVQGHSIGRWEDDHTLVIDTVRIASQGASPAPSSSSETHLVERLRLSEDRTHLLYSFEFEDPEHLTTPISGEGIQLMYRPDMEFEAVPCDIENARRFAN